MLFILAIGLIGVLGWRLSHAATFSLSAEAEQGTPAGSAKAVSASGASAGSAVSFASSAPPPPATSNPKVSSKATYKAVPNQVLFSTDASGQPVIAGDLANFKQGDAGDCYFLAALMALAAHTPATVQNLIRDNGNGTYTASFYSKYDGKPNPVTVTVNGDLPYTSSGKPFENGVETINGKTVTWVAVIEKLWAAANGNAYDNIDGTDVDDPLQDHDLHNALYALTGKVPTDRQPGGSLSSVSISQIQQDFKSGVALVGTGNDDGQLVSGHTYAVIGVDASTQKITLGNPEGGSDTLTYSAMVGTNTNQYIAIPSYP